MGDTKEKLLQQKKELELKLNMFLNNEYGLRHTNIIEKLQKELESINNKLNLMDSLRDINPIEEKQQDPSLVRMMNKFDSEMETMEILKKNGREYHNSFARLQKLYEDIQDRLNTLRRIDGVDVESMKSTKYHKFIRTQEAIQNQLEEQALAAKRANTELSESEKLSLLNASLDASIGLSDDLEGDSSNE